MNFANKKLIISSISNVKEVAEFSNAFKIALGRSCGNTQYYKLLNLQYKMVNARLENPRLSNNPEFNNLLIDTTVIVNKYATHMSKNGGVPTFSLVDSTAFFVSTVAVESEKSVKVPSSTGAAGAVLETTPELVTPHSVSSGKLTPSLGSNNISLGKEEEEDLVDIGQVTEIPEANEIDKVKEISEISRRMISPEKEKIVLPNFIKNFLSSTGHVGNQLLFAIAFAIFTSLEPVQSFAINNIIFFAEQGVPFKYSAEIAETLKQSKSFLEIKGAVSSLSSFVEIGPTLQFETVSALNFYEENNLFYSYFHIDDSVPAGYQLALKFKEWHNASELLVYLAGEPSIAGTFDMSTIVPSSTESNLRPHLIIQLLNADESTLKKILTTNFLFTSQLHVLSDKILFLLDQHDMTLLDSTTVNNFLQIRKIIDIANSIYLDKAATVEDLFQ